MREICVGCRAKRFKNNLSLREAQNFWVPLVQTSARHSNTFLPTQFEPLRGLERTDFLMIRVILSIMQLTMRIFSASYCG